MKSRVSMFWVAALSGMIGAGFGTVAGNHNVLINMCVGIIIALLVAWGISGFFKF